MLTLGEGVLEDLEGSLAESLGKLYPILHIHYQPEVNRSVYTINSSYIFAWHMIEKCPSF